MNTTTTPLISFIIPVYNVPAEMLKECIDSIMQLTLSPQERQIILVDDGSETPALDGLDTGMRDQLLYLRQRNGGVSTARNLGLQMAEGQFVQFIDGDDLLLRPAYEHALDLMRFGHTDMVMFNFTDNAEAKADEWHDEPEESGAELMRHTNIQGSVCAFIFRRAIVGSLRFTPGVAYGEDEEFTPRLLLRADHVVLTSAVAYLYRQRPSSAINSTEVRSRLQRLNDAKAVILRLHHQAATLPAAERVALQRRTAQLTMDYIYNVIMQTRNRHYLDRKLGELRRLGLFPLPDRDYTLKYKWFRRLTNSGAGIKLLMNVLPMLNKER